MAELIQTFHIDWQLMIAQLVNFAIVFFVIYRFGLKPLMKTMAERSATIAKSLDQAKKIEDDIATTAAKTAQAIKEAKQQSAEILAEAARQAEQRKAAMAAEAESKVAQIVTQAKEQIESEKQAMLQAVKVEAAELIVSAVGKILRREVDATNDKKLMKDLIKEL